MNPTKRTKIIWLVTLACLPVGLLLVVHQLDRSNSALSDYRVDSYHIVVSHAERPPVDAAWQEINEPIDLTAEIMRNNFNSSWVAIDPPQGGPEHGQLAIYLPTPRANVSVYLGSVFVGASGAMVRPLPFYMRPLYFPLPVDEGNAQMLQPIYLRIAREDQYLTPNAIYVGPAELLIEEYHSTLIYELWLPAIVATSMLGLAATLVVLYLRSGREYSYYGIYALMVTLWALHTIHGLVDNIRIEHWTWFMFSYLLLWWVVLAPAFANRFFDLGMPRVERVVLALATLLTIPIFAVLLTYNIPLLYTYYARVWVPFVLVCASITLMQYAYAGWRYWSFESIGMYAVGATVFVFGMRDHLFDFYSWIPGTTYYMRYVAMIEIAFINLVIARRHAQATRELASFNQELAKRVRSKTRELEDGYIKRRKLEREYTLSQERERLMRDMHDGLGGQIIQALAISEREGTSSELRDSLEQALIDLRLIVDSIAPAQSNLISLLASIRHRSSRVWKKSGVTLSWDMADVPEIYVGPERSLNILRIVQEAMTNALRHGNARHIQVSANASGKQVCVEIRDDGSGFDPTCVRKGSGLVNMRRRAEEANVSLRIDSSSDGTRVRVCIPILEN